MGQKTLLKDLPLVKGDTSLYKTGTSEDRKFMGRLPQDAVMLTAVRVDSWSFYVETGTQWTTLTATLGIADKSAPGSTAVLELRSGGTTLFQSDELTLGQTQDITVNVSGVVQLELVLRRTSGEGRAYLILDQATLS